MGYGRVGRPKNSEKVYRPTHEAIEAERAMRKACRFYTYYPEVGPLRRDLYPKHMAFMAAGKTWKQRAFLAGNRSGKTDVAAYETVCHLTGQYPEWWKGRVFDGPTEWWAAGDTAGTVRDILQVAMLGPTSTIETKEWAGMIPRTMVYDIARKPGVPLAVSTVWVRHKTGGMSSLDFRSYDQKREAFQGTARSGIWLDEEPPEDIYGECLVRTMTTDGLVLVTFTPLQGLTPFIASWLERSVVEVLDEYGRSQLRPAKSEVFKGIESADMPDESDFEKVAAPKEEKSSRYIVMASWDECVHLTEEAKDAMLLEFPPHQRDARSKGIPALGSGVIYPIPESEIKVAPFEIPPSWPRGYGMDIDAGAGWTAALWAAHDRTANVYYVYDCYKRSHAEPVIHAEAIKARGKWIPGVADAAALLVTAGDVEQMLSVYRRLGLNIVLPQKGVEAAIFQVWQLLSAGRLKIFSSCGAFFEEFRLYRRDGKGRVVKQNDHLCDCLSYLVVSGFPRMKTKPEDAEAKDRSGISLEHRSQSWLQ